MLLLVVFLRSHLANPAPQLSAGLVDAVVAVELMEQFLHQIQEQVTCRADAMLVAGTFLDCASRMVEPRLGVKEEQW